MGQESRISFQVPEEESLLAYIRGKASEEEIKQVDGWLQEDEANEKVLLQIATLYFAQNRQNRIEKRDPLQAFEKAQRKIRSLKRKIGIMRFVAVAACIAGVILMSTFMIYWRESSNPQQAQLITIQANSGMRSQFSLSDGTVVYLNSGSRLSYPAVFEPDQRSISLTGEAYFQVTHNPECPFVVSVCNDRMQVKVLGTEFNLSAYENETSVMATLVSGKITLITSDRKDKDFQRVLQPSEKATYDLLTGNINIEKVDTQYETAWIQGKLMFKNSLMPDVLKKLAYFYNVKFEVKDETINQYRLTGVFDNRQLTQVLDYLKISSQINYRINQTSEDDSQRTKKTMVTLY